jgi:hypothetical protein
MGRLTLNVLLSFAQFEREVIGERVRDKIVASKRKGLWMGGGVPFGFALRNKKLIISPPDAERVRWIFRKYLELGSMGPLLEEMYRLDVRTELQIFADGRKRGGVLFRTSTLTYLLKNRCYVGEIVHRGEIHAADHEAIVDRETFEAVQSLFAANAVRRKAKTAQSGFLLAGLIYDSAGNRLTPSHSRKRGVRYRYYVSQALLQSRKGTGGAVCRLPAPDLEAQIERFIRTRCPGATRELRNLVTEQIDKIMVHADHIDVSLKSTQDASDAAVSDLDGSGQQVVQLPWSKKPFPMPKGIASEPSIALDDSNKAKAQILTAIGKATRWVDELMAGQSLQSIAKAEGKGERQIRLLLSLAFMPPAMVRDIVADRIGPPGAVELAKNVPVIWASI